MLERSATVTRGSRSIRRAGGVLAESVRVVARVVLWFAAITGVLVLAGIIYALISGTGSRLDVRAVPAWFLRLSPNQWIGLGCGLVAAVLLVVLPCAKITARGREQPSSRSRRVIETLAVVAVLVLYAVGVSVAYRVSRALGSSRDWAVIHSVYSWAYVGFAFYGWVLERWNQPLGKTLRQFLSKM